MPHWSMPHYDTRQGPTFIIWFLSHDTLTAECPLACFFLSHCQRPANQLMRIECVQFFVVANGSNYIDRGTHNDCFRMESGLTDGK